MKKKLFITVGIIAIIIVASLIYILGIDQFSSPTSQNGKLQVVASFYPMYYFASQIGGDKAEVINITPAGAEPHDYEPTAKQLAQLQDARLLILNGGTLETWGNEVEDELKKRDAVVVTAGENLANKMLIENGETTQDPHVWLDPLLAKQEVVKIAQGFAEVDSANASFYETNAKILENKLDALDKEYAEGLSFCARKDFVTSHTAFSYLSDRYKLNQIAISGVSPDEEPTIQKLAEISDFVKAKGIKYIFFESLVSPKLSETIAEEVGAKTMVLDPIEGISDGAIRAGQSYFTQMETNLKNLKIALECQN